MFRRPSDRYVVLQEHVPLAEQRAIEQAVVALLPLVPPSPDFVNQLGQDLIEEARRQQRARVSTAGQTLRVLGIFSGGIFSLLGGIALWFLLQNDQQRPGGSMLPFSRSRQRAPSPGSV